MRRSAMRAVFIILGLALLSACAPSNPNGLGEMEAPPPYQISGCKDFGQVIDYAETPGRPTAIEAMGVTMSGEVESGYLTQEQANVISGALIDDPDGRRLEGVGQVISTQSGYTASVTIEEAGSGTFRVGQIGLECTG